MSFEAHAAFFYPQDSQDPARIQRSKLLGLDRLPNEYALVQTTKPLFEGHDQPKIYSLDGQTTTWEDTDPQAVGLQVELAQNAGLTCFFIDTYQGNVTGKPVRELYRPLDELTKLESVRSGKFKFANFAVLGRSRVQFPLTPDEDGTSEPNRNYDLTTESARYIIDVQQQYWNNPGYIHINGKPLFGIFLPREMFKRSKDNPQSTIDFINELKQFALKEYKVDPYLVGTITSPLSLEFLTELYLQAGVDALTSYAFLPDFYGGPFIQSYPELVQTRIQDWQRIFKIFSKLQRTVPFWPSAVNGWDASSRGPRNVRLKEAEHLYPFHPIVNNVNAQDFGLMLQASINFVNAYVKQGEKLSVVCAFNEVGEDMTMLPRKLNGQLDTSFLDAHRTIIDNL